MARDPSKHSPNWGGRRPGAGGVPKKMSSKRAALHSDMCQAFTLAHLVQVMQTVYDKATQEGDMVAARLFIEQLAGKAVTQIERGKPGEFETAQAILNEAVHAGAVGEDGKILDFPGREVAG